MDELLQKISMYNIDKLVFWTGAGIDYDRPTCLPLGNELTEILLTHACGTKYAKKIFEEWTNSRNIFNKVTSENICLAEIPRLETVLEG